MKKEMQDYSLLVMLPLIILAGVFSSSNGFDDAVYRTPTELIHSALKSILVAWVIYTLILLVPQVTKNLGLDNFKKLWK